jgi:hypothetical protein
MNKKQNFFKYCEDCEEKFTPKSKYQKKCESCLLRIQAEKINNLKIKNYLRAVEQIQ